MLWYLLYHHHHQFGHQIQQGQQLGDFQKIDYHLLHLIGAKNVIVDFSNFIHLLSNSPTPNAFLSNFVISLAIFGILLSNKGIKTSLSCSLLFRSSSGFSTRKYLKYLFQHEKELTHSKKVLHENIKMQSYFMLKFLGFFSTVNLCEILKFVAYFIIDLCHCPNFYVNSDILTTKSTLVLQRIFLLCFCFKKCNYLMYFPQHQHHNFVHYLSIKNKILDKQFHLNVQ